MEQMLRPSDALLGGYPFIARLAELFGKPFKQRALRSLAECLNPPRNLEEMFQHDVLL
jgi:hypothetical protein